MCFLHITIVTLVMSVANLLYSLYVSLPSLTNILWS